MKLKIFLFFFFLVVLCNPMAKSYASDSIQSSNEHITVFPAKFEISGNRKEKITHSLKITNEDDEPAIIALSLENFSISGETGEVVLGENKKRPSYLSRWIKFDQQGMEFKGKETKVVNFTVDIPENAPVGGNYVAVIVSMDKLNKKAGAPSGISKVMSLILLSVVGDLEDKAKIKSFEASRLKKEEIRFQLRVANDGSNHIKPRGTIVIANIWGKKIDEVPLEMENVLPGVVRRIDTYWHPQHYLFGLYNATLVANYGYGNNKSFSTIAPFWILPWPIVVVIFFILFLLTNYIITNRHHIKKFTGKYLKKRIK